MHVEIDEAGGNDQAARVESLVRVAADLVGSGDLSDAAIAQEHVHGGVYLGRGIDDTTALDQQRSRF